MAHTFDIRFARSAGFAALLEAPTNSFRWTGSGRLSIDAQGVSVAVKRGLLSLLARNRKRRIPAADIKEVIREGESLRVEFTTSGESAPASLLFWARDRDTAAQIVSLLPTTRTVELEHSTNPRQKKFRSHLRAWAMTAIVCALGATLAWQLLRTPATQQAAPVAQRPIFDVPSVTVPVLTNDLTEQRTASSTLAKDGAEPFIVEVPMPPLRMPVMPLQDVIPLEKGTPAYRIARWHLKTFESEAATLWAEYRVERDQLASRKLPAHIFAEHLEALELRWWNVTFRILDSRELDAPDLVDLRASLLGAARNWRGFLHGYARGLRDGDHLAIAASFDQLAIAEEQQARARQFAR
ncbi:MAG: hypothetical protein ABI821_07635 [Pseudomonadota bacterium]